MQDVRQAVVSRAASDVQDARPEPAPAARRRRPVLVAAGAVLLVALALTGVKLLGGGDGNGGDDGPDRAADSRQTPPSASGSPSPPPAGSGSGGVSLTTLQPVAKSEYAWFEAGDGTLGSQRYDTALVAAGPYKICDGAATYDLGGGWKTLTMVAGVDDASTHANARVTVEVDGKSLWSGTLRVGSPQPVSLDVANGRRLAISYVDPGNTCGMGRLVLGTPTLTK